MINNEKGQPCHPPTQAKVKSPQFIPKGQMPQHRDGWPVTHVTPVNVVQNPKNIFFTMVVPPDLRFRFLKTHTQNNSLNMNNTTFSYIKHDILDIYLINQTWNHHHISSNHHLYSRTSKITIMNINPHWLKDSCTGVPIVSHVPSIFTLWLIFDSDW